MMRNNMHTIQVNEPRDLTPDTLHDEVTFLTRRLQQLGTDGNCSYEKALSRIYQTMLHDRLSRIKNQPAVSLEQV